MKTRIYPYIIALLATMLLALPGCRRATDNGKIDGLWKIDRIEWLDASGNVASTENPPNFYIAIQLELLQLDNTNPVATAIISYSKGDDKIGLDFPYKPSLDLLRKFGITENPCVLTIEKVDSKRMVLRGSSSRIICTRY